MFPDIFRQICMCEDRLPVFIANICRTDNGFLIISTEEGTPMEMASTFSILFSFLYSSIISQIFSIGLGASAYFTVKMRRSFSQSLRRFAFFINLFYDSDHLFYCRKSISFHIFSIPSITSMVTAGLWKLPFLPTPPMRLPE